MFLTGFDNHRLDLIMSTLLRTEWPGVKKEVNGAVSMEFAVDADSPYLAYKTYLDCLVKLLSLLRRDATIAPALSERNDAISCGVPAELVTLRRNFVKLAQQCLERVNDLADSALPPPSGGGGGRRKEGMKVASPGSHQPAVPNDDVTFLLPDVPQDLPLGGGSLPVSSNTGNSGSASHQPILPPQPPPPQRPPSSQKDPSPSPSPNTPFKTSSGSLHHPSPTAARPRGPGSLRYLPSVDIAQNQKATLNMAAFRKMEEERKIAKKNQLRMEQRMKERKKALEEDALAK